MTTNTMATVVITAGSGVGASAQSLVSAMIDSSNGK